MGPKEKPSKKAVIKKMESRIEDATFGLKNKNKSSKVQQFVERAEKSAKNSAGAADAARAKEAKKELKLAKQLQEEELRLLFNEGITGQFGKKKTAAQSLAQEMGLTETAKEVQDLLDAMSSDDEDEDGVRKEKRETIYVEEVEGPAVEVFRDKTLEDIIEEQRAELAAQGKIGTPVTEESFRSWRQLKLAQRQAEAEARLKLEQAKKKGGRGLSVLSGKELFNFNAALFVDDDAALDAADEEKLNALTRLQEEEEEAKAVFEAERARFEQRRLEEERQLEEEERRRAQEERKRIAALALDTFILGNVLINQAVFDFEDYEDLIPFLEEDGYISNDEGDEDDNDMSEGEEEMEEGVASRREEQESWSAVESTMTTA